MAVDSPSPQRTGNRETDQTGASATDTPAPADTIKNNPRSEPSCKECDPEAEKRKESREVADVRAQLSMAESAIAMLEVTWGQFVVGLGGLAMLGYTLYLTRESNKAAIKATVAAEASAKAAIEQSEQLRREFIASRRPCLQVLRIFPVDDKRWSGELATLDCEILNSGDSAAQVIQIVAFLHIQGPNDVFLPNFDKAIPMENRVGIAPGRPTTISAAFESLGDSYDRIYQQEGGRLFGVGYVRYRGQDGTERVTGFCRRYDRESGTWVSTGFADYEYAT